MDLKKLGFKITVPRLKILEMLEHAKSKQEHISAEEMYRQLLDAGHDIGLATVYRVLTQFETAGLVLRHHFEEARAVFELADDEHHDHLVCVKCSAATEFVDEMIEHRQAEIAKQYGFQMTDHALYIYGVCQGCQ